MRRSTNGTREQIANLALQDAIGRQPDHVAVVPGFEELVDIRVGEGCIATEIEPLPRAPVAGDHRLQHRSPAYNSIAPTRTIPKSANGSTMSISGAPWRSASTASRSIRT